MDTHIWVWWVSDESKLNQKIINVLKENEVSGLCISIISLWEVSKLVEKKKLEFTISLSDWMDKAVDYPGIRILT